MKNNVKQLRINLKLTQQDLADQLGITRQAISSIENGLRNPTIILALKIAEILQIPVDEVFVLEPEDKK